MTGASRGIGKAIALHLDDQGYRVFAGVEKDGDEDSQALREAGSDRLTVIQLDITNQDEIDAAAKMIGDSAGEDGLYGLVNNAGICANGPIEFFPVEEFRRIFEVNFFGQLRVMQTMLPLIRKAPGRIINVTSGSTNLIAPFEGPYSSSKCAFETVTEAMHFELGRWGIKVVSIIPGWVDTGIFSAVVQNTDRIMERLPEEAAQYYGEIIKRRASRVDFAQAQAIPPERVAHVVRKALTAKRPRRRYQVGLAPRAWKALNFLPTPAKAWLFSKVAE